MLEINFYYQGSKIVCNFFCFFAKSYKKSNIFSELTIQKRSLIKGIVKNLQIMSLLNQIEEYYYLIRLLKTIHALAS